MQDKARPQFYWIGVHIITDNNSKHHFCEYKLKYHAEEFAKKFGIDMPKEL
jgi:hypothetical protein